MCGIVGYWTRDVRPEATLVERMALEIEHRGPDDAGVWLDETAGLALAHRRLSIIDVSAAGHLGMLQSGSRLRDFCGSQSCIVVHSPAMLSVNAS